MNQLFTEMDSQVATRTFVLTAEATSREYIMTVEAETMEAEFAVGAAIILDAMATDASERASEAELLKDNVATTVYEAVGEKLDSEVIVNVAAESLNQKVGEIFEERLIQAVNATQEALQLELAATATQEALVLEEALATQTAAELTATPTPTPTP